MKHFFHKSAALILFTASVSFILSFFAILAREIKERDPRAINDVGLLITVAAALVFLLLLNTVEIVEFWLRGKTVELKVKRLVGIQTPTALASLFFNLNVLIFLSVVLGSALAMIAALLFSSVVALKPGIVEHVISLLVCGLIINLFCALLVMRRLRSSNDETRLY